jgi:hypothetical protein
LQRQRAWCVGADPHFAEKAADVIGLYLKPPENAIVLPIDEKPGAQALERPNGHVLTGDGQIVRGIKSAYARHGAVSLFAASQIAASAVASLVTKRKRRVEFLEFMDMVVSDLPQEIASHVIMDNYCIHKKRDSWLSHHPNATFHFTPASASRLNMVEIFFGILSRKALKGGDFASCDSLKQAIEDFIKAYNENAEPFVWTKPEAKGSQLRSSANNFRK